jgi:RecA-family ATPase
MSTRTNRDVALDCLRALGPAERDSYDTWLAVGMICKEVGLSYDDWANWSSSSAKWDPSDAVKKWRSFNSTGKTLGSLVHMARATGAQIDTSATDHQPSAGAAALGWDSLLTPPTPKIHLNVVDAAVPLPDKLSKLDADEQIRHYITTLYQNTEKINIVTAAQERKDKWLPHGYGATHDYATLLEQLNEATCITDLLPDFNPKAGAWCRINPVDGKGISDANVTDYRHVLVESDAMPIEQQFALYQKLHLPIAAIVSSGRASLHAIVKISAGTDRDLYNRRVDHLYSLLAENGFKIDRSNRNPARLSRLPGVGRGDGFQQLIAVDAGANSYQEWLDHLEGLEKDDLPDVVEITNALIDNPPPMKPELIAGVLRIGHTLLLSGPSKAGKSYNLIQLALAVANGTPWMGIPILTKGRVLIVNLEVDEASYINRVSRTAKALNLYANQISVWTLRGHAVDLCTLVPKLVRRLSTTPHACVIIDPIYKVLEGDENSNSDMAKFWRYFDKLTREAGCAVVIAHHFSKGVQGGKASIDRSSGAGMFGRAPDGCVTLTPVDLAAGVLPEDNYAFQVDYNLREFKPKKPTNVIYANPLHVPAEIDAFGDAKVTGATAGPGRPPLWPPAAIHAAADSAYKLALATGRQLEIADIRKALDPKSKARLDPIRKWIEGSSVYEFAPDSVRFVIPKTAPKTALEDAPF